MKESAKTRNKAGRPTEEELVKRKARIIAVATDLFFENGYAATSLVEIAKRAGVATRTLYEHFGNKESIFQEIMHNRDVESRVLPPTLSTGDTLYDVLMRVAYYVRDVALSAESVDYMRLMVAESKRFPDMMKRMIQFASERFRKHISKIFQDLEKSGLIPVSDHLESTALFIDLVLGNSPLFIYSNWKLAGQLDDLIQKKVELFILGRFGPDVAATSKQLRAQIKSV